MDDYEQHMLLGSVRRALADLREQAEKTPSRPLSLAITKLEEAVHWLEDPQSRAAENGEEHHA